MIEFDIIDEADQQFGATLNGQRVTLRLRYNEISDAWSFDLSIDDLPVLHGRRIVTGVDLLQPYDFGLGIIFAVPVSGVEARPNRRNLPDGIVRLYHTTEDELDAIFTEIAA